MMPQVEQTQVPVQVTRMQQEVVQQQVPVSVTRMEAVQEVRKIPYSVQKPVTRRIERQVPVDRMEWVQQEMVRPKTIERTSYKLETIEEEVPVQFYETEAVKTTVRVPRLVPVYEPYTVRRLVPRVVQSPVVLSYNDPYSVPLSMGRSAWMPATDGTPSASETIRYGEPRPAGSSILENSDPELTEEARSSMKVEMVEPNREEATEAPGATDTPKPSEPTGEAESPADLELAPSASDNKEA
jgi:hypothetical protein